MTSELDYYKSNGFFIAKGLLDEQRIEAVRRSIAKSFLAQLAEINVAAAGDDLFSAMQLLHKHDIERYKKTASAIWRKLDVYQLMHDPKIIKFLYDKFGWQDIFVPGGQVAHIMAHELKIPNGYFGLIAHQDFPSVQGSLDGVVVWLPLVNIDQNNFPLELIPGSHKRGLLPMVNEGNVSWEIQPDQLQEQDYIAAEVEVGDVVFMSMFTVHRSSKNGTSGRYRLALSTRFDNANEPTFINRCYPSAYERHVHRAQYVSDFPTIEQIDSLFKGI
jgi:ectoine hydroxylase-related dioxygenase (phytanoyl-CoA dioxygenase family)